MSFQPADMKKYFLLFLSSLGDLSDLLAHLFNRTFQRDGVIEFFDVWEDRLAAIINRKDRWIGLLPLITGLIIVFFVLGKGVLNWLVLIFLLLIIGLVLLAKSEKP